MGPLGLASNMRNCASFVIIVGEQVMKRNFFGIAAEGKEQSKDLGQGITASKVGRRIRT